jgi:molybdopterin-guanine dinucleotide biosynthesis protein A
LSPIPPAQITGVVLAGGRGSRMGGVDKGLQPFRGRPLALHALERLRAQVGPLAISANRHLDDYRALTGLPTWPDALPGSPPLPPLPPLPPYAGPLAGMLSALSRCDTPWLMTVPCDSPCFPLDLVARLAQAALDGDARVAMPQTPRHGQPPRVEPVFCLLHRSLRESLGSELAGGQRGVERWARRQSCALLYCADARAFANANTLEDLHRLDGLAES